MPSSPSRTIQPPVIHVAVGVIVRGDRVLLSKRHVDAHQGGKWEFPGGKVEQGEDVSDALVRELEEELDITPTEFHPLIRVRHDYPDCSVLLDVWRVASFFGTEHGREGQELAWVDVSELGSLDFPAANYPIVLAAQWPAEIELADPSLPPLPYCESLDDLAALAGQPPVAVLSPAGYEQLQGEGRGALDLVVTPVYLDARAGLSCEQAWSLGFQGIAKSAPVADGSLS